MNPVFFIVLRRMRTPLLLLISAYAIAIAGLVTIPGVDDQGNPWQFDFLHAFYFISYTASTIGFGEVPYPFTPGQRLWVSFSIYLTVLAWLYAFGNILALLQDAGFQRAIALQRFRRQVRRRADPFYLICGYGETGMMVAHLLASYRIGAVVLDKDQDAITTVGMETNLGNVPALAADARDPAQLAEAGLHHPLCLGVVAVTGDDEVNVDVALAALLLNPGLRILCQAQQEVAAVKLPSRHGMCVIDPFNTFGASLALAIHQPCTYRLLRILGSLPGEPFPPMVTPPKGQWILCGYGRFGRAMERHLRSEGVTLAVIENGEPIARPATVMGSGTDTTSLVAADIDTASGIIAGTDSDIANLGILLNARERNPAVFTVLRQNLDLNNPLVAAARPHLVMETSRIVVGQIVVELINPLLRRFLLLARDQSALWAEALIGRLMALDIEATPESFVVSITEQEAPAVHGALAGGRRCGLGHLLRDPMTQDESLPCVALLAEHAGEITLLPEADHALRPGEQLLFAGIPGAARRMQASLLEARALHFAMTGEDLPVSWMTRWLRGGLEARARGTNLRNFHPCPDAGQSARGRRWWRARASAAGACDACSRSSR
ncbi:MAG: potassium channel family protein [Gammaproteobacteria bacterium]|nr:potassium channel family protein [Gammaproteobacteria bacterium]